MHSKTRVVALGIFLLLLTFPLSCVSQEAGGDDSLEPFDERLFLQFLHDEIPLVNYGKDEEAVYFSDVFDIWDADEKTFYIVDMDGDGVPELGYRGAGGINIMRYDAESNHFELWLTETYHDHPIGDGQMYYYARGLSEMFGYYRYDENANLIESQFFVATAYFDEETGQTYVEFEIDFEPVSESEWYEEIAFLLELMENAPKPLSYRELSERINGSNTPTDEPSVATNPLPDEPPIATNTPTAEPLLTTHTHTNPGGDNFHPLDTLATDN